ncbi:outer membrane protein assembly factor BamD [Saccharicrinis sp. FJH62]|uniref:outer membrane protein assembly factor BamD n=1 Tax=Saccharicrinis sp. FJH62 TaxID=3344657 RepID=UPI0035D46A70
MRNRTLYILIALTLLFAGCGEYNKVLKSTDAGYKYNKAKEYYLAEDYNKAVTLFSEVYPVIRGSDKSEEALYLMANAYYGQGDNLMAGHYFGTLAKTFPNGPYVQEAYYMAAYCLYLDSPKPRLDQAPTKQAIDAFELYVNLYPKSENAGKALNYIDELREKLVQKDYLNAKLYFDLGNYLGNNYKSAVITAENVLKEYPDTKYREDLSFLILKAKYMQALNSVESKLEERYRSTVDEYYSFSNDFPESSHLKEAEKMFEDSQKVLKRFN